MANRDGHRLRVSTRARSSIALGAGALVGIGWSLAVFVGLTLTGDLEAGFLAPSLVGLLGTGGLGSALFRLPRWARRRERQLDEIATRARTLLSPGPADSPNS